MDTGLDFDSSLPESGGDPEDGDVNVEALYIVGEFEVVPLRNPIGQPLLF